MPTRPLAHSLAAILVVSLAACDSPERLMAAPTDLDPPQALMVSPDLLAAVGDAEERVLPALDPSVRPDLQTALADLHAALAAGQAGRSRRALEVLRARLASSAPTAEAMKSAAATAALPAETLDGSVEGTARAAERPAVPGAVAGAADLAALEMLVRAAEQAIAASAVR